MTLAPHSSQTRQTTAIPRARFRPAPEQPRRSQTPARRPRVPAQASLKDLPPCLPATHRADSGDRGNAARPVQVGPTASTHNVLHRSIQTPQQIPRDVRAPHATHPCRVATSEYVPASGAHRCGPDCGPTLDLLPLAERARRVRQASVPSSEKESKRLRKPVPLQNTNGRKEDSADNSTYRAPPTVTGLVPLPLVLTLSNALWP